MTKKKIMIPIMSIMLATSSMTAIPSLTSVNAAQEVQEAYTYQVETQEGKQHIVLTDYKGSEEKITIPDQINGIEVKSIQDGFGKNSKLKNIASEKDTKRSLAGLNQITTLEEIQTVKDNAAYQSEDGILYTKDKKELEEMIRQGRWDEFIRVTDVKKGDFFQINPGCLHAIKGGTVILETQQNSDITYRVYDYDRLSDGKPRQLHVEQSIDTIVAPFEPAKCDTYTENLQGAEHKHLITCPFYSVDKYDVDGVFTIEFGKYFTDVSVVEGSGTVNGIPLEKGQHFIVPAGYGKCRFEGVMSLICSNPEKH